LEDLKKISPVFEANFSDGLNVVAALAAKKVPGGTAPEAVRQAISDLEERLNKRVSKIGATP
jgi:argininosuccinate lyase